MSTTKDLIAKRDYVHEVEQKLGVSREFSERIADFVVAEIERIGAENASLVFEVNGDGTGPYCSWCWTLGGLCTHLADQKGKRQ
ncbi:hypothetical protein [Amycolatopsis circi]|uniref:hypothetical protein n=1 Tax=Amycolatopsis circi TaxID=871959 RepID=UPI000E2527A6|nr:hypothetical protein [Amycolatopsis circi]